MSQHVLARARADTYRALAQAPAHQITPLRRLLIRQSAQLLGPGDPGTTRRALLCRMGANDRG